MKTSKQIVGLPIIGINDGKELGTVKSLVVNPEQGTIDFITVHHEDWQISVKAVPFKKVIGVGDYAVTIESEMNIIDLTEIPIANTLVTKNIKIIGARVMSKKGQLLGKVTEYFVNEDNGSVIGLQLANQDSEVILAATYVYTFAKDILIVNEDADQNFYTQPEELLTGQAADLTKQDEIELIEAVTEQEQKQEQETVAEILPEIQNTKEKADLTQELLDRQIALLEGKKVTSDIYNKSGQIVVEKGTSLTKEMILAVNSDGPASMVELSMNVETD